MDQDGTAPEAHNPQRRDGATAMLYRGYQALEDAMAPARWLADAGLRWRESMGGGFGGFGFGEDALSKRAFAMMEMVSGARFTHHRPSYKIDTVLSGNREVAVREEIITEMPWGNLLRFAKDDVDAPQPKVLVVAALSGHFATLLRDTVRVLLKDHDVYITDWKNARDVPKSAGRFGFEEYIDYVIHFLQDMGPRSNVLAVCQPCVPALAAVAIMSEENDPATPRTMTLMGGPVDTRVSPTVVNELATSKPLDWFEKNLISRVPWRYPGAGRRVYPGFLQLAAFMSMNVERHGAQHRALYQHIVDGKTEEAAKIRDFYDEYFAVLDMSAEFYLETVDVVFQRAALAAGQMTYRGNKVDPSKIRRTALLTVEGEKDDICAVGQTAAAHTLCSSLRPHLKRHHLQPGAGHYGIFSGSKWEKQVYPQVRNMILAMA